MCMASQLRKEGRMMPSFCWFVIAGAVIVLFIVVVLGITYWQIIKGHFEWHESRGDRR